MNKPITVKAHLSIEAIETRYRKAKDPVERSHWHIIWLLTQGKTTTEIALVTGYCPTWIRTLAHRYNDAGPQGLGDRRHSKPSSNRPSMSRQPMAACGPAPQSPARSRATRDAKCIRSEAGSISSA